MSDPTAEPAAGSAESEPVDAAGVDEESPTAFSEALANAQAAAEEADAETGADGAGDELVAVTAERDEYLDALQRLKAEFSNHRKRVADQQTEQREQAAATLVENRDDAYLFRRIATVDVEGPEVGAVDDLAYTGPKPGFAEFCHRIGAPRLIPNERD